MIELEEITVDRFEEFGGYVSRYKYSTWGLDTVLLMLDKCFVFGYFVISEGKTKGVAFALLVNGMYSLDGYNEGVPVFDAVRAGRKVVQRLFDERTDTVYTSHLMAEKGVTALAKRIGFRSHLVHNGVNIMRMTKHGT